jgi:hypothetical protein
MKGTRKSVSMSLACAIALASQVGAQQAASTKEKVAADSVAKFVEQVRDQNGLSKLRRIEDLHLREDACRRATKGDKSPGKSTGIGPPEKVGMLSVLWYSTIDPNQPAPELVDWTKRSQSWGGEPHRFAVAACLAAATEHSEERYYLDIGTYMSAIKSFFYRAVWD